MKRLFKFFPVALAAVALASCSSDDLQLAQNGQDLQLEDGKLYVEVEGNNVMRGGFASAIYENSKGVNSLFNALMFEAGDRIKVYCDQHNWRSQVWKLGTDQQYLSKKGVASFEPEVAGDEKYVKSDEIAYGIYPYTNEKTSATETDKEAQYGWFTDEDRSTMEFNFRDQAMISYSAADYDYQKTSGGDFTGETVAGAFYKTPFPLWGVKDAGKEIMTMKFLTGILRVDYIQPTETTNDNYIVVVADKQLNGKFVTTVEPENLGTKAPLLVSGAAASVATEVMSAAGVVTNNAIVVNMGKTAGHKLVYIPLPAQAYTSLKVYKGDNIAAGTALETTSTPNLTVLYDVIAENLIDTENETQKSTITANENFGASYTPVAKTVYPGVWYRVNDDSQNKNTTATSPFQMVQAIIAADKAAYRDFTIEFTNDILVDNSDDAPQRQWIDFQNTVPNYGLGEKYKLNHKVTVKATFNGVASNQVLKIKNIGGENLTLNVTQGANKVNIMVDESLSSPLTISGAIQTLVNYSNDNLTVTGSATSIHTDGKMTINTANTITNLAILNKCKKVTIKNGTITSLFFAPTADKVNAADKYEGNNDGVDIYTEGTGYIQAIAFDRLKTNGETDATKLKFTDNCNKVKFTSKLTYNGTLGHAATSITGAYDGAATPTAITKAYVSAMQLKGGSEPTVKILAQEIDLNSEFTWTPKATAQELDGNYKIYPATSKAADAPEKVTIKNAKIGIAGGKAGLYVTANASKNLKLKDFKMDFGTTVVNTAGALASDAAGVTLENIEVENLSITSTAKGKPTTTGALQAFGGLIGTSTNSTVFKSIKTSGTISGYASIGGILGQVNVASSVVSFGARVEKKIVGECSSSITADMQAGTNQYDPTYAMIGTMVGSISGNHANSSANIWTTKDYAATNNYTNAKWSATVAGSTTNYQITNGLSVVGFCGFDLTKSDPTPLTTWIGVKIYTYPAGKSEFNTSADPATAADGLHTYSVTDKITPGTGNWAVQIPFK